MQPKTKTVAIWNQKQLYYNYNYQAPLNKYVYTILVLFCKNSVQEPLTELSKLYLSGETIKTELLYAKIE